MTTNKPTHTPELANSLREEISVFARRGAEAIPNEMYRSAVIGQLLRVDHLTAERNRLKEINAGLLAALKSAQNIRYFQIGIDQSATIIGTRGPKTTVESILIARANMKTAREGIHAANKAMDAAISKAEAA